MSSSWKSDNGKECCLMAAFFFVCGSFMRFFERSGLALSAPRLPLDARTFTLDAWGFPQLMQKCYLPACGSTISYGPATTNIEVRCRFHCRQHFRSLRNSRDPRTLIV